MNNAQVHIQNVTHALNSSDDLVVVTYEHHDEISRSTAKLTLLQKAYAGMEDRLKYLNSCRDHSLDTIEDLRKGTLHLLNSNLLQRIKFVFTGVRFSDEYLKQKLTENYKDN